MTKTSTGEKYRDAYEEAVINEDGSLVNPIPDSDVSLMRPLFTDRRDMKKQNLNKEL